MKIIELQVSNFARLRAITIRPDGAMVPITGANSSGKTSTLKAIWTALKGRAVAPPRPIHEGAEEAIIRLDLGEIKITRKFSRDDHGEVTTDMVVTDKSGGRIKKSPQAMIDAMLADLSFDPLAFSKMKPDDQYAKLKSLVPGVDFDGLAADRQKAFDNRTISNRDAKEESTIAARIELPVGPMPDAVDVAAVIKELNSANDLNNNRVRQIANVQAQKDRLAAMDANYASLMAAMAKLEKERGLLAGDIPEIEANIPAEVNTKLLQDKISSAQRIEAVRSLFRSRTDHEAKAAAAAERSAELTREIAAIDTQATDAIAAAKLPGGLTLDAEKKTVMLDGLPLQSAGTAERIIASAKVAMALSPDLRVMLIDEGSELDRAHMAALSALAEERDYQVWIARVEEGESGAGFRIEDGSVSERKKPGGITSEVIERSKGQRK